jgi:hypothetical protein
MRTRGVALVVVAGCACFSAARYDEAHFQRVANINARYEAERRQQHEHYVMLRTQITERRSQLIPVKPGSTSEPVRRVDERADLVACRQRCGSAALADPFHRKPRAAPARCQLETCQASYVDALTRTYFAADMSWVESQLASKPKPERDADADVEALLTRSHNQALAREIDEQLAYVELVQARIQRTIELARESEIQASRQQRDAELSSRRARVRAAADASALDQGIPPRDPW